MSKRERKMVNKRLQSYLLMVCTYFEVVDGIRWISALQVERRKRLLATDRGTGASQLSRRLCAGAATICTSELATSS